MRRAQSWRARALVVLSLCGPGSAAPDEEALSPAACRALEAAGADLVQGGRRAEAERVLALLEALGLGQRACDRLRNRWEKDLARAPAADWTPAQARRELERAAAELAGVLPDEAGERRLALARALFAIDDQNDLANLELGSTRQRDVWMRPERALQLRERDRLADLQRWASSLSFSIEHGDSRLAPVESLGLAGMRSASSLGLTLHSRLATERVRRVLTEALRACAFSYAVSTGRRELPRFARVDYLILPHGRFEDAIADAAQGGGLDPREAESLSDHSSFQDARGWFTCRWHAEPELEAQVLFDQARGWLGWSAQPALLAGHVNWVALRQLGTMLPQLSWKDPRSAQDAPMSSTISAPGPRASSLWRTTERGLFGTRRYMMLLAARGADPPWSRSMTDEIGKIQGLDLLKSTLVVEYLTESGSFLDVLNATRGKEQRVAAFEQALGQPLPSFEAEWRAWLLEPDTGLLQLLERGASEGSALELALRAELDLVRRMAFAQSAPAAVLETWLDPELSAGAARHARYLMRHPAQKDAWPAAHEEYPDRAGFSAQGAWAANHAVIHIGDPRASVAAWMGTFYHRLPLLDPGLLGIGLGADGDVTVADVRSLVASWSGEAWVVWPPDGGSEIPLEFHPELPYPVPGRSTSELGYPVTLQLHGQAPLPEEELEFELRRGGARGEEVPFYLSSPAEPTNPALVPPDAYCLIPAQHLRERTQYWVHARRAGPRPRTLSWTFTTGNAR